MKKRYFSFWDSAVFGFIAFTFLLCFLAPVFSPCGPGVSNQEAKADANMIYCAMKMYYHDYGHWPMEVQPGAGQKDGKIPYAYAIKCLAGNNRDKKNYLPEIKGADKGIFLDPWEQEYVIIVDLDGDGSISSFAHSNITSNLEDERIAVSTTDSSCNVIGSWAGN